MNRWFAYSATFLVRVVFGLAIFATVTLSYVVAWVGLENCSLIPISWLDPYPWRAVYWCYLMSVCASMKWVWKVGHVLVGFSPYTTILYIYSFLEMSTYTIHTIWVSVTGSPVTTAKLERLFSLSMRLSVSSYEL